MALFFSYILNIFIKHNTEKKLIKNSEISDIPFRNKIKAEKVNINQTIINNSTTGNINSKDPNNSTKLETNIPQAHKKINEGCFRDKNELRAFIFKEIDVSRDKNLRLEIRHITDAAEDKLKINHDKAICEIEKLEEEGFIRFEKKLEHELTPYTRIRLTEKYYEAFSE